jgi:AraC-like DNA-binding protein
MTYLSRVPLPPFDRYIERLYYMEGQMPSSREKIAPTPALNLQFNLGDALHLYDSHPAAPATKLTESWLGGLYGVHHSVEWTPCLRLYGVRFKPNGASPFLRFPLSEVYNQIVALDAVWGRWASEIRERLQEAPTVEAGLSVLEQALHARFRETPRMGDEQKVVAYAVSAMRQKNGALSIRRLSDHIGISQNHLGTLFKRLVGTSAKELARLYRFEHALRSAVQAVTADWTEIAQQCGYYDSSHLNRDFVTFTGDSPSHFLSLHRCLYARDALLDPLSLCTLPTD